MSILAVQLHRFEVVNWHAFRGILECERECFDVLARANWLSVEELEVAKGKQAAARPYEPAEYDERAHFVKLEPMQLIKACDYYAYQANEARSWIGCRAQEWTSLLREQAIRLLPGYEPAVWGIDSYPPEALEKAERWASRFAVVSS